MKEYVTISHEDNDKIDTFVNDYKLFAVFEGSTHILFAENFINNIGKFKDIFRTMHIPDNIFFSCKSNKSPMFLKLAAENNCGIEVSSVFELNDALKFTNKIIASGPAKSDDYISKSIKSNIIISVDDICELKTIISFNKEANILLRISNIIGIVSRFGINISQIEECLRLIRNSKINLMGFSFHINNYDLDDRVAAINEILDIVDKYSLKIKYIDIGGGIPTNYCSEDDFAKFLKNNNPNMYFNNKMPCSFYPYYSKIADEKALGYILKNIKSKIKNIQIIVEPGRSLLKNCGITIFKVMYLKELENEEKLLVVDGNINELSEQWFNSDYLVEPVLYKTNYESKLDKPIFASIVGNLCLEQDIITRRKIKFDYLPEKGDFLIYFNTAGYQMDSNESEFHKIPVMKKVIINNEADEIKIRGESDYDCQ